MSYESESVLRSGARIADVRELVSFLGYKKSGVISDVKYGQFECYEFFEERDYRSWSGVSLAIQRKNESLTVSTRTPVGRSYYDLLQQNRTIYYVRKWFGGTFRTDEGKARYLRPSYPAPAPAASGCYLAFSRFGENLIKASMYHMFRTFVNHPPRKPNDPMMQIGLDPRLISNNMMIPFFVAMLEEYFKGTFIALLRYSERRKEFLKGIQLKGEQVAALGERTLEEQIVEALSFQRISIVCKNFYSLDPKLDLATTLRKPFRRRRISLYDQIEAVVEARHRFIHAARMDTTLTDDKVQELTHDLDEAISRVNCRLFHHYSWPALARSWHLGKRRAR